MARKSAKERREALRRRTQQSGNERNKTGLGGSTVLDISGIESLNLFKPKSGQEKNFIDILPFEITQDWYPDLRTKSGRPTGLEPGLEDYKLEVPVHSRIGVDNRQFLCRRLAFGKKCPICEELRVEYDKPKSEQSEDVIRALTPSWRCYYNIYDYNEPDKDLQLWTDASYHLFEKNFLEDALDGEEYITFSDLERGKSIEFKGKEKSLGESKFIEAQSIEFKDRDAYEESILDETLSLDKLLIIPTYDEVNRVFLGLDEEEETQSEEEETQLEKDDNPPDEEKPPARRSRSRKTERKPKKEETPEEIPAGGCPDGGIFGIDCNEREACQDCPEEIFNACADAQEGQDAEAQTTGQETEEKQEEKPEPTPRRRRTTKKEEKKTEEKPTSRRRQRRK